MHFFNITYNFRVIFIGVLLSFHNKYNQFNSLYNKYIIYKYNKKPYLIILGRSLPNIATCALLIPYSTIVLILFWNYHENKIWRANKFKGHFILLFLSH